MERIDGKIEYNVLYRKLHEGVYTVIFYKRNAEIRCMLATRDAEAISIYNQNSDLIMSKISSRDVKFNKNNGSIAVFDLIKDDLRAFNINRVVAVYEHGSVDSSNKLDEIVSLHEQLESKYLKEMGKSLNIEQI